MQKHGEIELANIKSTSIFVIMGPQVGLHGGKTTPTVGVIYVGQEDHFLELLFQFCRWIRCCDPYFTLTFPNG